MDINVTAFRIVQQSTTESEKGARALAASKAGRSGGKARALKLTAAERKAIAERASQVRWKKRSV